MEFLIERVPLVVVVQAALLCSDALLEFAKIRLIGALGGEPREFRLKQHERPREDERHLVRVSDRD